LTDAIAESMRRKRANGKCGQEKTKKDGEAQASEAPRPGPP
jgi:hypothetical protein